MERLVRGVQLIRNGGVKMSEQLMDCSTATGCTSAIRVAIVAVGDEVRGIRALYACLQRSRMERVILGVQPVRKGEMTMSEMLMDCSTMTDHTLAKRPTILLVEDEERVRRALHALLQRPGYEVIGVGTVEEAEQCIAARGSENIAVILCDIHLHPDPKELEAYEFYQRWTAEYPELPFILMSGDHSSWDLPAVRSGAVHFLAKPFNVYDLLAVMQSVLEE
jgi:CheY-like chemotaxis protein